MTPIAYELASDTYYGLGVVTHWLLKTVFECFAKARKHREVQLFFSVPLDFMSGTPLPFSVHELNS